MHSSPTFWLRGHPPRGYGAIGKVVFTSREHIIALEARDKGLLGVTLRYPYEVRKEEEYFDDIPDEKLPDMLDLSICASGVAGERADERRRPPQFAFRGRNGEPLTSAGIGGAICLQQTR
jgi:hypothetical protein